MTRWFFVPLMFLFCLNLQAGSWAIHASSLKAKIAEIEQLNTVIENLVEQKTNAGKTTNTSEIVSQIVTAHEDLEKKVKEYNKLRDHVRFEHPEQGDETEVKYREKRYRSIDEFEESVGIFGKLDRMRRKLKRIYNIEDKKPPKIYKKEKKKEDLDTEVPRVKLSF